MTKEQILEQALNKACIKLAHELYLHEDEEDEDCKGVNVASALYRADARELKQRFIKEAESDCFPYL